MDCKVTVYISEKGTYPFKRYIIDAMLWEETKKIVDNKKDDVIKIYVDTRRINLDYITANNHNLVIKGEVNVEITSPEELKKFITNNKPYLINSISKYEGNLSHIIIGAK